MSAKKRLAGDRRAQVKAGQDSDESRNPARYRRNITMRGQSAYSQGASPRLKAHRLRVRRRQVVSLFVAVLLGFGLIAWLVSQLSATVVVTSSSASQGAPSNSDAYQEAIQSYLSQHPIERLRFLLNEEALSEAVSLIEPEVKRVSLSSHNDIATASAYLEFRKPVASWHINNTQYFVDENGVVFKKNYFDIPKVQIVDESGSTPEQGSTVTSSRFLSFVGRVVAAFQANGYEVGEAILPAGTTRQLQLEIKDVRPTIILSIDRGAGEQVSDVTKILNYLSSRRITAQYVDVRVSGKAVYR